LRRVASVHAFPSYVPASIGEGVVAVIRFKGKKSIYNHHLAEQCGLLPHDAERN